MRARLQSRIDRPQQRSAVPVRRLIAAHRAQFGLAQKTELPQDLMSRQLIESVDHRRRKSILKCFVGAFHWHWFLRAMY
jgi:hypothetical protein